MIQNLFRHKFNILYITLILSMSLSTLVFAEEHPKQTCTTATQPGDEGAWTGIDVSVVGKYAAKYGHPPRAPYINTDQGDLLLFVFTFAGVVGGFIIGFNARRLFYEK